MPKIKLFEDLTPLSEFRLRTAELMARVKKTRHPLILTQHGRSIAVPEDIQAFEQKPERLEHWRQSSRGCARPSRVRWCHMRRPWLSWTGS